MDFRFSDHALQAILERGLVKEQIDEVLANPGQVIQVAEWTHVYQSRVTMDEREYLIRVIVATDTSPNLVVTAYRTSKLDKYWRTT